MTIFLSGWKTKTAYGIMTKIPKGQNMHTNCKKYIWICVHVDLYYLIFIECLNLALKSLKLKNLVNKIVLFVFV